jgi:hypothetical protein
MAIEKKDFGAIHYAEINLQHLKQQILLFDDDAINAI